MTIILYDGSFDGFLSAVFACYARRIDPHDICRETAWQGKLFPTPVRIVTDGQKAARVWNALRLRLHKNHKNMPFFAFLSQDTGIEMILYRFIRKMFNSPKSVETDYGDADSLELRRAERKVMQEAVRIHQFVRFQETRDGLYFAPVEPAFDVLALTLGHFKSRFARQKWLIYDVRRDYGFFYDLQQTHRVVLTEKTFSPLDGKLEDQMAAEQEQTYQTLWKDYFNHITIGERKNLRLQRQHMPARYWKFLPEKM
ncbi:MAG: TIGR03915 family putative DNA repair protein [Mangrovibacterium sp.]